MQTQVDNDHLSKQLIHSGLNEKFSKILVDEIRAETHAVSSKEVSDAHKTLSLFWKLNPVRGKDLSTRLLIHMATLLKDIDIEHRAMAPNIVTKIPANGLEVAPESKPTKHTNNEQKPKRTIDLVTDVNKPSVTDAKLDKSIKRKKKDA